MCGGGWQASCPVKVQAYDWTEEVPTDLGAVPFDIILGTDVAYYEHLYAPFVEASWGEGWCVLHASRGLPQTKCSWTLSSIHCCTITSMFSGSDSVVLVFEEDRCNK